MEERKSEIERVESEEGMVVDSSRIDVPYSLPRNLSLVSPKSLSVANYQTEEKDCPQVFFDLRRTMGRIVAIRSYSLDSSS